MGSDNRQAGWTTDDWLTPPEFIEALGLFDLDPCCSVQLAGGLLPWTTATRMVCLPENGLDVNWKMFQRVWVNPPWSNPQPWAKKLHDHGRGIMLVPAKSTDTIWGQTVLQLATEVLFLKGRPLFRYPDGSKSTGKWSPVMLVAFGELEALTLRRLNADNPLFAGICMRKP
jgi:hypothetical protein